MNTPPFRVYKPRDGNLVVTEKIELCWVCEKDIRCKDAWHIKQEHRILRTICSELCINTFILQNML